MFNSSTLPLDSLLPSQIASTAQQLIQQSMADPWGDVSPAIYDTARVLLLPPVLQPKGSLDFILCNQNDDGSWGGPGNYCLVPSLAATASLLELTLKAARQDEIAGDASRVAKAAQRGLYFVAPTLGDTTELPDTVAIELIVPALVEEIINTLAALAELNTHHQIHEPDCFWQSIWGCLKVKLPSQDMRRLARLRAAARSGEPLPIQLCHTLEVLGSDLDYVNDVRDVNGVYGGSPAATIAMLNRSQTPQPRSIAFISQMAARLEGALPTTTIDTFERAWILYNFIQAGVPIPANLARAAAHYFTRCLGSRGAGFAQGLMPDADDSGMVLFVLSQLGYPFAPESLLTYEAEAFFRCYDGERNPSISANAHVLEAFGSYMSQCCLSLFKYQAAIAKISAYLLSFQQKDGSWVDKWHVSPYYATACSVLGLRRFGVGDIAVALERAVAWVLRTQRDDGSWGVRCGTLEETAYALQIILLAGRAFDAAASTQAALLGERFLTEHFEAPPSDSVRMPLWHGKELYEPGRVVSAAVLSALHLCATLRKGQSVESEILVGCVA